MKNGVSCLLSALSMDGLVVDLDLAHFKGMQRPVPSSNDKSNPLPRIQYFKSLRFNVAKVDENILPSIFLFNDSISCFKIE